MSETEREREREIVYMCVCVCEEGGGINAHFYTHPHI